MVKRYNIKNNNLHVINVNTGKYNYTVHIQNGHVVVLANKTKFDMNELDNEIKYIDVLE
jgi:hypothetical protein